MINSSNFRKIKTVKMTQQDFNANKTRTLSAINPNTGNENHQNYKSCIQNTWYIRLDNPNSVQSSKWFQIF